jgi:hypothetical protein
LPARFGSGVGGGDHVGGVPVERVAGPVVADRGSRVGVAGGVLDVSQWYPGVESGGDDGYLYWI